MSCPECGVTLDTSGSGRFVICDTCLWSNEPVDVWHERLLAEGRISISPITLEEILEEERLYANAPGE